LPIAGGHIPSVCIPLQGGDAAGWNRELQQLRFQFADSATGVQELIYDFLPVRSQVI